MALSRRAGMWLGIAAVTLGLVALAGFVVTKTIGTRAVKTGNVVDGPTTMPNIADGDLTYERLTNPDRTIVKDSSGTIVARLTDGARTADLTGPMRTFSEEKNTSHAVRTTAWIRLMPNAWKEGAQTESWFLPWLTKELADRGLDIFAIAMQYTDGAPNLVDKNRVRYAGDAGFGPLDPSDPDGRAERNDFLDYLGIPWTFPDRGIVQPKPDRYGYLDCSGFIRTVYGYRSGYPLRDENTPGVGLPRRAWAMSKFGPGVEVIKDERRRVPAAKLEQLQPGDLVFFDTDPSTVGENDHSGIYLGRDDAGHYRFISSRSKANGPTFGDYGGAAILDGNGHFALTLRNSRRV